MTPSQERPVMVVMVTLIVALVALISYIWYSETQDPLFGSKADIAEENKMMSEEIERYRYLFDSVTHHISGPVVRWEISQIIPDSLACPSCAGVEHINGHYFQLIGSYMSIEDARFSAGQLLKLGVKDLKILKREGLTAVEEPLQ